MKWIITAINGEETVAYGFFGSAQEAIDWADEQPDEMFEGDELLFSYVNEVTGQ